jgi:DtxR family Mn-dependent transcriptional regulator
MGLTRSKQDYLKAFHALAPAGETVGTSQLAAHLGISPPSVTNMLARLARERLVSHTPRAGARLTARGRREALAMVRRHRILESFLVQVLGIDSADVHSDAEILEHHVSDRVLEALDRFMGHPEEDPHGHPIPDAHGHMLTRRLRPIASLVPGDRATVREVRDQESARVARWKELGLVPGATVRVRAVRPLDGVLEMEVAGHRRVLAEEGLDGVMVEMRKGAAR